MKDAEPPEEPEYDDIVYSPMAKFIGYSPFLGFAVGAYLLNRGPDELLFTESFLQRFEWFAVLPFEQGFIRKPTPFLLEYGFVSNILALINLFVGLPLVLTPRPIAERRIAERFWYYAKLGVGSFIIIFAFREFGFFEMSQVLRGSQIVEGRNRGFFVLFPAGGQILAVIILACVLIAKVAIKSAMHKSEGEN
ncbi:MAG: hypothetical protein AB7F41_08060 [Methylocystis sp.]|uniref:hypothetical protein n=1 Tax=Methylocystis sp. TaxID=1911079 RepID=UPI003D13183A